MGMSIESTGVDLLCTHHLTTKLTTNRSITFSAFSILAVVKKRKISRSIALADVPRPAPLAGQQYRMKGRRQTLFQATSTRSMLFALQPLQVCARQVLARWLSIFSCCLVRKRWSKTFFESLLLLFFLLWKKKKIKWNEKGEGLPPRFYEPPHIYMSVYIVVLLGFSNVCVHADGLDRWTVEILFFATTRKKSRKLLLLSSACLYLFFFSLSLSFLLRPGVHGRQPVARDAALGPPPLACYPPPNGHRLFFTVTPPQKGKLVLLVCFFAWNCVVVFQSLDDVEANSFSCFICLYFSKLWKWPNLVSPSWSPILQFSNVSQLVISLSF